MNVPVLDVFYTVVEEGSFSRASERLLRTQPAVSLAIRRLEEELGERLIDRSSRELLLTDAGQLVYDYARRFRNLGRDLARALEELRDVSAGRLVIGANESSTLYLLQHLRRFRRAHPQVSIRVRRCLSSRIPQMLLEGDLELGMTSYNPGLKELQAQVIYVDHLSFIVAPEHRFAKRKSISIGELGMETFIAHNVVSPYREVVLREFQKHEVPLHMEVEMPTIESIRKLVQRNEGVAFLPAMVVEQEVRQGVLREVKVRELEVERRIRLLYPKKRTLSRASKAFLETLKTG